MSPSEGGRVIVVMKLYPKGADVDLNKIASELEKALDPSRYRLLKWEEEYIAFGYKALRVFILAPEELEGGTEELENIARSISSIDNVEVELVTRALF